MAHAKTSAAHVFAQLTVGAGLGSIFWLSLRPNNNPSCASNPAIPSAEQTSRSLDAEIQSNTTSKIWGLPRQLQQENDTPH